MIKSVTVTNYLGESVILELTRPDLSGFLVKEIDGLGPVKADINTTKRATMDGVAYNSAFAGQRDITFQLQFYAIGADTIEDIRHRSYKYFPLKKQVTIRVETDKRISETVGYVETNEPNIFSNSEGCTITVVCPDPYFYSTKTDETIFYGIEPTFEFPLFNDSPTEPMLELGMVKSKTEENVFNSGDAEVGLSIIMHATGDVSNVTIYNLDTRESMVLNTDKMPDRYREQAVNNDDIVWTEGAILNCNVGTININSAFDSSVSDYIAVMPNTTAEYIVVNNGPQDTVLIAAYDSNYNYLGNDDSVCVHDNGTFSGEYKIPTDAAYVRISTGEGASFSFDKTIDRKIMAGDTITISTVPGNKGISLLRRGQTFNILNCVTKTSKWFTLRKGDNLFAFKAETGAEHLQFRMENKVAYIGV